MKEPLKAPSEESVHGVLKELQDQNININPKIVEVVVAATLRWIGETKEGLDEVGRIQKTTITPAPISRRYFRRMFNGMKGDEIPPEMINYRYSITIGGQPSHPNEIIIEDRPVGICKDCGAELSCVEEGQCSYCAAFTDAYQKREIICDYCTETSCVGHPVNRDRGVDYTWLQ